MTGAKVFRRRTDDESGYVAMVVALCFASFFFGCAALAVDVSRWYLEAQRVQKAADAAALGAVTYMPMDLTSATTEARTISSRNDYPNSGTSTVTVEEGAKPSQLKVTVCSTIKNSFGAIIGLGTTGICRYAVADYTGPAPMGSPCNIFGNEPNAGAGTATKVTPAGTALGSSGVPSNCQSNPKFWAVIGGPASDKGNGDRFMTTSCGSSGYDGCSGSTNTEYDEGGYFYLLRIQPNAVGKQIKVQLYDPEFSPTSKSSTTNNVTTVSPCGWLPANSNWSNNANDYVTDAQLRYGSTTGNAGSTGASYCPGDLAYNSGTPQATVTTSFALRQQTDTQDPHLAPVQKDTSGTACIKQYKPSPYPTTNDLNKSSSTFDDSLAQIFHNWTSLCTFVPTRAGDYYIQVRSNVTTTGGTATTNTNSNAALIYTGNTNVLDGSGNTTSGSGANAFSMRAVITGNERDVSLSGYDRMPIYANGDSTTSLFNLIRVVPAGAGKSISFTFYDVGDSSNGAATVKVIPPADAKTTGNNTLMSSQSNAVKFPGSCKAKGGYAGAGASYADCTPPIQGGSGGANNGHTETLIIPIPDDYTCTYADLSKCWYQVQVSFTGNNVTDLTTWTATIIGDPVRLIE